MDDIQQFIDECCDLCGGKSISSKNLYGAYARWAEDNGRYKMSGNNFGRKMGDRFKKRKSHGVFYYDGIDEKRNY